MRFSLRLVDTPAQIEKKILSAMVNKLNKAMDRSGPIIDRKIQDLLVETIKQTPVYRDMQTRTAFRGEMGIPDSVNQFKSILKAFQDSVTVTLHEFYINNRHISGQISVGMIHRSFDDVLNLPAAKFASVTKGKNGTTVTKVYPWLEWLIKKGTGFLVQDYVVTTNPKALQKGTSRTGQALMQVSYDNAFKLAAPYAGTIGDNFVTRAIGVSEENKFQAQVGQILVSEFLKKL